MLGVFEPEKVVQAAAVLLKATEPHRMSYLRLLKLLYIADRESIQERGRSITGDRVVAMDHGPVLSEVLDCINGHGQHVGIWEQFIRRDGRYDLKLEGDPGTKKLSRWEAAKLASVVQKYEHLDQWQIVKLTHEFEEWKKSYVEGTSTTISAGDVLEALGLGDEADQIMEEARTATHARRLLATTR